MKLGFIGAGAIASAIIKGIIKSGAMAPGDICAYDINRTKVDELSSALGIAGYRDCSKMVHDCDMILLAVKPHQLKSVVLERKAELSGKAVISIAAGWNVKMLRDVLPGDARIMRVMPNTPALVGKAMTAFSTDTDFTEAEQGAAEQMFRSIGKVVWVDEDQFTGVIAVSGSAPAYVYMFIEAMADGAVAQGLTRKQALEMAAQTVLGSAKMVLETGLHPGELKDMVCSPGGTTIQAVLALENSGLRSTVIEGMNACAKRAREMEQ